MDPKPEQLAAWDKAFLWHPFTPMSHYLGRDPVIIESGEGVRLRDVHGRWYFDGVSSVWLNVHGHRAPELNAAITEQLDRVAHSTLLGQANVPAIRLAKRLAELTPAGLERVFFSDSGATAVEVALKIAVQFWANQGHDDRKQVLGFTTNYHGDTLGAMSVAYDDLFHWPFQTLLPHHPRAPYPHVYRYEGKPSGQECAERSLAAVESILKSRSRTIAAAIIEPVQGAGGIIPAPEGYLRALAQLCRRHDVLLIVDEVATGFARTGPLFACDAEDVRPDLLCLGKGLTGGYLPVAATLASARVFEAFLGDRKNTLFHGHSYTGNQLGCGVALANLELLEALLPQLPDKIEVIASRLERLRALPFVGDVRHRGFMLGVELVTDKDSRDPFPGDALAGHVVADAARDRGMLIRPIGNVVIFMPPLASTAAELEAMLDILEDSLGWASSRLAAPGDARSAGAP